MQIMLSRRNVFNDFNVFKDNRSYIEGEIFIYFEDACEFVQLAVVV